MRFDDESCLCTFFGIIPKCLPTVAGPGAINAALAEMMLDFATIRGFLLFRCCGVRFECWRFGDIRIGTKKFMTAGPRAQ